MAKRAEAGITTSVTSHLHFLLLQEENGGRRLLTVEGSLVSLKGSCLVPVQGTCSVMLSLAETICVYPKGSDNPELMLLIMLLLLLILQFCQQL